MPDHGLLLWAFAAPVLEDFAQDPIEFHGSRLLTGLLLFGIALLLCNLIYYRGRIAGSLSWGLLISGVVVLPSVSILFGTLLMFERAEQVEFCASCHVAMQAYVQDLENPDSQSLAAVHYKNRYIPRNQCYICHTSFGLFGTAQAKIAGVVDVRKYYTGTFHLPIKMREPYLNTDCLKCHAGAVKWSRLHAEFGNALLADEVSCLGCHGRDHPAHILTK
ncbi:MAG TPA: NapC/NirT family cytochrome c [Bryobacteraceae bacterium]|nr:NapC/NirT family cytochrome c [Bryobacteraceae bacterium]